MNWWNKWRIYRQEKRQQSIQALENKVRAIEHSIVSLVIRFDTVEKMIKRDRCAHVYLGVKRIYLLSEIEVAAREWSLLNQRLAMRLSYLNWRSEFQYQSCSSLLSIKDQLLSVSDLDAKQIGMMDELIHKVEGY